MFVFNQLSTTLNSFLSLSQIKVIEEAIKNLVFFQVEFLKWGKFQDSQSLPNFYFGFNEKIPLGRFLRNQQSLEMGNIDSIPKEKK